MGLGSTNVKLYDIWAETNPGISNSDNKLQEYCINSWEQGPTPGSGAESYWGGGLKTGIQQNILYNPVNNGASAAGTTTNYKMSYFKNFYGYMDQSTYICEMYIENNLAAAGRGDPPNDVTVDHGLTGYNDLGFNLAPLDGSAGENGGTYGPIDKSISNGTFNVYYFWLNGGVNCLGNANYNLDMYVNGNSVYSNGGLAGITNIINNVNGSNLNTTPTNIGNGFTVEYYFA